MKPIECVVKRGMIIDGEFIEGVLNALGVFKATKYRRGAKGLLVMLSRRMKKRKKTTARSRRVKCHNILKFAPLRKLSRGEAI